MTFLAIYLAGSFFATGLLFGNSIRDRERYNYSLYFSVFIMSWFAAGMILQT